MHKLVDINFDISRLSNVIDEKTFHQHYHGIYKEHVESFNNQEGDIPFHKAGAFLHELYFENIREYRDNNLPIGKADQVIHMRYGSFENFIKTAEDQLSRLQGSGWIFMNSAGYINIIPNNRIVKDICLIIDFWEHAYLKQFGTDRVAYFRNHISIIDWNVVNHRMSLKKKTSE